MRSARFTREKGWKNQVESWPNDRERAVYMTVYRIKTKMKVDLMPQAERVGVVGPGWPTSGVGVSMTEVIAIDNEREKSRRVGPVWGMHANSDYINDYDLMTQGHAFTDMNSSKVFVNDVDFDKQYGRVNYVGAIGEAVWKLDKEKAKKTAVKLTEDDRTGKAKQNQVLPGEVKAYDVKDDLLTLMKELESDEFVTVMHRNQQQPQLMIHDLPFQLTK